MKKRIVIEKENPIAIKIFPGAIDLFLHKCGGCDALRPKGLPAFGLLITVPGWDETALAQRGPDQAPERPPKGVGVLAISALVWKNRSR